jgi:hypothetical protein
MKRFMITTLALLALSIGSAAVASEAPPTLEFDILEVSVPPDIDLLESVEIAQDVDTMTQDYYGTKLVTAWPQRPSADQHGSETLEGYAVKYSDGYVSWSPKDVFESAYQPVTAMSFGHALQAMEDGQRVARSGWNGKGMWLRRVDPYNDLHFKVSETPDAQGTLLPYIAMKTADNGFVPWLASQSDMLAKDWLIYETPPASA